MKTILTAITVLSVSLLASAQNKKYVSNMEKNVSMLDTSRTVEQLQPLSNTFERIANAEKAEWLPNYYVAYCNVNMTYGGKSDMIDTYCDKAEKFIKVADSLNPNNSEVYAMRSQIASARIGVNPMLRGQKYGSEAAGLRNKAKELDPTNPRPWLLEGQAYFYTPSAFGGGKDKAKPAFEKAISLYETFKPASSIHPNWGKGTAHYFLQKCNE